MVDTRFGVILRYRLFFFVSDGRYQVGSNTAVQVGNISSNCAVKLFPRRTW